MNAANDGINDIVVILHGKQKNSKSCLGKHSSILFIDAISQHAAIKPTLVH
jgi:hypothetical protein